MRGSWIVAVAVVGSYRAPPPSASFRRSPAVRLSFLKDAAPGAGSSARDREAALVQWLQDNGVRLSDKAGWGVPAHPLRVEGDTVEDFEVSGRGLLARKEITQGECIVQVPSSLIMTRATALSVLGPKVIADSLNEYLALAMLLRMKRKTEWDKIARLMMTTKKKKIPKRKMRKSMIAMI